jgi:hypothetical protein
MISPEGKAMSGDDAITTLAMRVEELTREVDGLREQRDQDRQDVAAAKTAVAQWNARLTTEGIGPTLAMRRDIKNLSERIDALAATLGTALDHGKLKAPTGPRWDNLDPDQEAAQLARLREWVDGVLRVQYPGYKLPDCWPAHREALWELGGLHAEWQRVFDDPRGASLESMLWFHERWLPGTLGRLDKAISNTNLGCPQHGYGATGRRAAGR